jgi:transcriptional regulator with XRE-family HTH domain
MARSVINAYERGTRRPSIDALERIALSGGFELALTPRSDPVDPYRASRILGQVVPFAQMLPFEPRPFQSAPLPAKGHKHRG